MTAWVLIWGLMGPEAITISGIESKEACEELYQKLVAIAPRMEYPAYPGHHCIEYRVSK